MVIFNSYVKLPEGKLEVLNGVDPSPYPHLPTQKWPPPQLSQHFARPWARNCHGRSLRRPFSQGKNLGKPREKVVKKSRRLIFFVFLRFEINNDNNGFCINLLPLLCLGRCWPCAEKLQELLLAICQGVATILGKQ